MKKHLFILCLVYITITAVGQNSIPNGNFEQWASGTCDNPLNYQATSNMQNFFYYHLPFNATKSTEAKHGTYAVQLTTSASALDTAFGFFLNTNPNNGGNPSSWHGGMAYTQKPTGIRGYYKYNVANADSATIIVVFSKAGVNIGTYFLLIGGMQNNYALFNLAFNPPLSATPDSVIFGAVSCKISGQGQPHGIAGSTLLIDSVSFTGVTSQPANMNGDFELWENQTLNAPIVWFSMNEMGEGVIKTTDKVGGSYAMELKTYSGQQNNHPAARPAMISTGYFLQNCNPCNELGGYPFANQIDTLVFYYKYTPSGNDNGAIILNFKKNGSTIMGGTTGLNLYAAATYQYMEIPFNLPQMPDSVIVNIMSSSWQDTLISYVGSDLKIDEINFKSQPLNTGITPFEKNNSISIFPNPSDGKIQIQGLGINVQSVEVYNALAEKIYTATKFNSRQTYEIDLSNAPNGIYFVKIYDGEKNYTKKIEIR